jgi:hypothetical protein
MPNAPLRQNDFITKRANRMRLILLLPFFLTTSFWGAPDRGSAPKPIAPDQFVELRAQIKPEPGGFEEIPWLTNLWEARRKAAAEGKPLYVWSGGGPPCGCT